MELFGDTLTYLVAGLHYTAVLVFVSVPCHLTVSLL